MTIRPKTLELIARYIGDYFTGSELVRFLIECGIPEEAIDYPNTKWRTIYGLMHSLSHANNKINSDSLFEIITSFVHPLTFAGDEEKSLITIKQFNAWLKYDGLEIIHENKEINIVPFSKYSQTQEEFEKQLDKKYQIAIDNIKSQYLDHLILLKKSYQVLINIVNTFFEENCEPTEKLNEIYLKIVKIVRQSQNGIFDDSKISGSNSGYIIDAEKLYIPFRNLFGAVAESEFDGLYYITKDVKKKMSKYYGDIVDLFFECDVNSDTISKKELQKLFNEIELYLTTIKANKEQGTIQKTKLEAQEFICGALRLNLKKAKLQYKDRPSIDISPETNEIRLLKFLFEKNGDVIEFIDFVGKYNLKPIREGDRNRDFSRDVQAIRRDLGNILKNAGMEADEVKKMICSVTKKGYKLSCE